MYVDCETERERGLDTGPTWCNIAYSMSEQDPPTRGFHCQTLCPPTEGVHLSVDME